MFSKGNNNVFFQISTDTCLGWQRKEVIYSYYYLNLAFFASKMQSSKVNFEISRNVVEEWLCKCNEIHEIEERKKAESVGGDTEERKDGGRMNEWKWIWKSQLKTQLTIACCGDVTFTNIQAKATKSLQTSFRQKVSFLKKASFMMEKQLCETNCCLWVYVCGCRCNNTWMDGSVLTYVCKCQIIAK